MNFRWKKGFSPNNLHFYWVARRSDVTTFKWLLLLLPELKAAQLKHNAFYGGSESVRDRATRFDRTQRFSAKTVHLDSFP